MKKYSVSIVDNETKKTVNLESDVMLVIGADINEDELRCSAHVDLKSDFETISRMYFALGRSIQKTRLSNKYKDSKHNIGDDIEHNFTKLQED